jgi:hypothetical protein
MYEIPRQTPLKNQYTLKKKRSTCPGKGASRREEGKPRGEGG